MRPIGTRVVVTGDGSVSPFGAGIAALVGGVAEGRRSFERVEGACVARESQSGGSACSVILAQAHT